MLNISFSLGAEVENSLGKIHLFFFIEWSLCMQIYKSKVWNEIWQYEKDSLEKQIDMFYWVYL